MGIPRVRPSKINYRSTRHAHLPIKITALGFDAAHRLLHVRDMRAASQIERLWPELRAYAVSICGSRDEAEDLVQDAVERALRADTRPLELEALRPWMFRVIRNLHYDELRKLRVRREYFAAERRLSDESDRARPVARDILLRLAFEKLPPEAREVLFLVDVMGLKYVEAAQVMNVPRGTVMSRLSRSRKALLDLVDGPAKKVSKADRRS